MTFGLSFLLTIFNQRQTKYITLADVDINCFSNEKYKHQLSADMTGERRLPRESNKITNQAPANCVTEDCHNELTDKIGIVNMATSTTDRSYKEF